MNDLTSDAIHRDLPTTVVGRTVRYYRQVGSTNDMARDLARAGQAEGLTLIADEQTAGRGRMGRGWTALPGSSLLISVLLRPSWLEPSNSFALIILAGVALCEAIEQVTPLRAALKWPNDLLIGDAKLAGILAQTGGAQADAQAVVIGIGLNVTWPADLPDDLAEIATAINHVSGHDVDREDVLARLLQAFDHRYDELLAGTIVAAWRESSATLGRRVRVDLGAEIIEGIKLKPIQCRLDLAVVTRLSKARRG